MKRHLWLPLALSIVSWARAGTTIDIGSRYAYSGNLGWVDWRGDGNNGAAIGDYVCPGYIYSANVGWICLGSGTPTNGIRYQNLSAGDFGVNQDGLGNLRGYAYGANIGWVNFESTGAPKVDLVSGAFSGYAWSANCGWISLSNAVAYVQTDSFSAGQLDSNGLPIAWEMTYFGRTGIDPDADPDHDGMSNLQEYLAGTNPNDPNDYLHIISVAVTFTAGNEIDALVWASHPARQYRVQQSTNLLSGTWLDVGSVISPDSGTETARTIRSAAPSTQRFLRIQSLRPLSP